MRGVAVRLLLAALMTGVGSAPATAAEAVQVTASAPPRQAVRRIAALIRADFYDAARAARIADDLERAAGAGAFDRLRDPRDLAMALTRRLEPEDRHFQVTWAPRPSRAEGVQAGESAEESRGNHGFVEARVLPGGVGYLKIDQFAHFGGPGSPQQAAADAALGFVAQQPSLIIDLRDNGGGSPNMVGYLVQQFVAEPKKVANIFRSRRGPDWMEISPVAMAHAPRLDVPLYILVSGRTGSSAEALAYTLQTAGRAVVVGERTGGAANPGSVQRTADGFEIFISFGTPVNPFTAGNWEKQGVTPDIAVEQADALRVAHMRALEAEGAALPATPARVLQTLKAAAASPPMPEGVAGRYGEIAIAERDGALHLQLGRRPERTLVPLGADQFALAEEPGARYRLERDDKGQVAAIVRILNGGGSEMRFRKAAPASASLR
ncbi:S41 family peptidase [Sandaracinobacter sp. RS1-74]|uniref:S41 family peptidase n=1 Tax=Sandaracinobacteroides sayramensis TaxID=2913411 RepID=UPI001EDA1C1F|nr:S41 family peptidase [Sandaracinobacteroides sayramensis]MCG2840215.1 S41 family peptidase [Sandaracinobacteroides sayramensis]